uniref:Signal transducing adapter molecule 1 n=1 Tax=Parascaris univalens TaxID=6257 RepID=A0A915AW71_PARUN
MSSDSTAVGNRKMRRYKLTALHTHLTTLYFRMLLRTVVKLY